MRKPRSLSENSQLASIPADGLLRLATCANLKNHNNIIKNNNIWYNCIQNTAWKAYDHPL